MTPDGQVPASRATVQRILTSADFTKSREAKARVSTYSSPGFRIKVCTIPRFETLEVHHETGYISVAGLLPEQTPEAIDAFLADYADALRAARLTVEAVADPYDPTHTRMLRVFKEATDE